MPTSRRYCNPWTLGDVRCALLAAWRLSIRPHAGTNRSVATRAAAHGPRRAEMDLKADRSLCVQQLPSKECYLKNVNHIVALALAGLTSGVSGREGHRPTAEAPAADPIGEKHGAQDGREGMHVCGANMKSGEESGTAPRRVSQSGPVTRSPIAVSRTVTGTPGASHVKAAMLSRHNTVARRAHGPVVDHPRCMKYNIPVAYRWTAVLCFVLLWGCGGRAHSDGLPSLSAGGVSGAAGAVNEGPVSGGNPGSEGGRAGTSGAGAFGGGSIINAIDDESRASGQPVTPFPAAIFWRSPGGGWKIGNWFWSADGVHDVGLSPIEPPRDGSTEARHIRGTGLPLGVVLWLELDHPQRNVIDLRPYTGLTFWARLSSSSGTLEVRLNDDTKTPAAGPGSPPTPSLSMPIGNDWQKVTLSFEAFGVREPKAASIDFHVGNGGESFDLWIDDLAFLCDGICA